MNKQKLEQGNLIQLGIENTCRKKNDLHHSWHPEHYGVNPQSRIIHIIGTDPLAEEIYNAVQKIYKDRIQEMNKEFDEL